MNSSSRMFKGETADQRRDERRLKLREACLDLVGDFGVNGAGVNAICAQAGLTKRYFYESYADRDALLLELLDDFFTDLSAAIIEGLSEAPAGVEPRARRTAEVLLGTLDRDRRIARLYVESPAEPALRERRERAIEDYARLIGEHVMALDTSRREVVFASHVVVAGVTDVVSRWLAGDEAWSHAELSDAITALGVTVARL